MSIGGSRMTNPFMTPASLAALPQVTEHHRFPLPPEPRDYRPSYDNYGRYVLPDPEGGHEAAMEPGHFDREDARA